MNIVDVLIILLLGLFIVSGLKNGVFKQAATTIGTIVVVVLAFLLKNPLADILMGFLPFFKFSGTFSNLVVLNILVYQAIAFLILVALFSSVLRVIIVITKVFEKILDFTIILGIPSKILGALLGFVEGFVVVFIFLYFFSQPIFNFEQIKTSELTPKILNSTPVLSDFAGDVSGVINEVIALKDKYPNVKDKDAYNLEALRVMLNYKVVTKESVLKLIEKDKINIPGTEELLKKY